MTKIHQRNYQLELTDFIFPYGTLDSENRWEKMAQLITWDIAEDNYAKNFVNNGHPTHSTRCAYGALIIKQMLKCSDEELVKNVKENPYLQFFLGEKEYTFSCPFGSSTLVSFRKRISENDITNLMESLIPLKKKSKCDRGRMRKRWGIIVRCHLLSCPYQVPSIHQFAQ